MTESHIINQYFVQANEHFRDPNYLINHPQLESKDRCDLAVYLAQIAHSLKMNYENYYLGLDYFDRFLSITKDMPKTVLKLVGLGCLFLALKYEEKHPSSAHSLAAVTIYSAQDIIQSECRIFVEINGKMKVTTPYNWLMAFFHIHYNGGLDQGPRYQTTIGRQILEVCSFDPDYLRFPYRVIAAAIFALVVSKSDALNVSRLEEHVLVPCLMWITPFHAEVMERPEESTEDSSPREYTDQSYSMFSDTFDELEEMDVEMLRADESSLEFWDSP